MYMTWFMFSCNYHCLEWASEPIFGTWTLLWSNIMLNQQKDNLEYGFLKPEYPFKLSVCVLFAWFWLLVWELWQKMVNDICEAFITHNGIIGLVLIQGV